MQLNHIKKYDFMNIQELDVPTEMRNKIRCDIKYVDAVWGEGFTPGTVTIFTGSPGAGKTTLMLEIAGALGAKEITAGYNSSEEDVRQLKMTTERLGIDSPFYCGNLDSTENVIKASKDNDIKFLIIDSLQTMRTARHNAGTVGAMRDTIKQIIEFCKQHFVIGVIIGHVTKGNKIAGPQMLKHMTDIHVHMHLCTNPKCEDCEMGTRTLVAEKNRFGPAGVAKQLFMFPNGFKEI